VAVDLFAQRPPVELHEGMFLGNLFDHSLCNSRTVTQPCQVQLLHFAAAAHVVHQVERISFAANECHNTYPVTSNLPVVYVTSTTAFNVCFIPLCKIASKALTLPPISFLIETQLTFPFVGFATALEDTRTKSASFITFLALFHLFRASINCSFPLHFLRCFAAKSASCIISRLLLYSVGSRTIASISGFNALNTPAAILSLPRSDEQQTLS
jgi:hypothetical protein